MDLEFLTISDAPPPPPTAAYSHAVRAGDFLFVTGQLGVDPKSGALVPGGATEQAQQIMRNLETVLRGAGTSLDRAVMVRIYLVNFSADYPAVNKIYSSYFKQGRFPARTTVGVTNLATGALVEIDLIVRPCPQDDGLRGASVIFCCSAVMRPPASAMACLTRSRTS